MKPGAIVIDCGINSIPGKFEMYLASFLFHDYMYPVVTILSDNMCSSNFCVPVFTLLY